jgi:hypothetical protein
MHQVAGRLSSIDLHFRQSIVPQLASLELRIGVMFCAVEVDCSVLWCLQYWAAVFNGDYQS